MIPKAPFTARSHAALWCVDGIIYMFGGQGAGLNYLNDMWRYEPVTQQWVACHPPQLPSPRKGSATWQGRDGKLYLFGGLGYQDDELVYLNELWCFDPTMESWRSIVSSEAGPDGRQESQVWQDEGGDVYIHGGFGAEGSLGDFWRLSMRSLAWTALSSGPQPCYGAATWVHQNQLYLLGGLGQNDFWCYDTYADRWQVLADAPYSHYCPVFWSNQKYLYLWSGLIPAGRNMMVCSEDGIAYDIEQQSFEAFPTQIDWGITPRYGANVCTSHDQIIIFGGCTEKGQYHNDLWVIQQESQHVPVQVKRRATASMSIEI